MAPPTRRAPTLALALLVCAAAAVVLAPSAAAGADVQNFVVVAGRRFATIDDTPADSADLGCGSAEVALPDGWALAVDSPAARLAALSHQWGTICVVLADGSSLQTRSTALCGTAQLVAGAAAGTYRVAECARRVLVEQPAAADEPDETNAVLTNWFTFAGTNYAVLDNTLPTQSVQTCQTVAKRLPAGWTVAPDAQQTRAALLGARHTFGCVCAVLANGNSVSTTTGADCGTDQLLSYDWTYFSVKWCSRKVLVQRTATAVGGEAPPAGAWDPAPVISRVVSVGGYGYATMDNVEPGASALGCQDVATVLPAGWEIAPDESLSVAVIATNTFGTTCLVVRGGVAYNHAGARCDSGVNQLLSLGPYYTVNWCNMRVLIRHALPLDTVALPPRELDMRVLVVSATGDAALEQRIDVARTALQGAGVPFDEYASVPAPNAPASVLRGSLAPVLESASSSGGVQRGNYYAIVITSSSQPKQDAAGNWVPTLGAADQQALDDYSRKFGVRVVFMYSFPSPATNGAQLIGTVGTGAARSLRLDATNAARYATGVKLSASVNIANIWHYPATIADATRATPMLRFYAPNAAATATPQSVAAVQFDRLDGHLELHMFVDHGMWSFHSTFLSNFWLNWATNNRFVGARRIRLLPQVDDFFLSTEIWDTTAHAHLDTAAAKRCSDKDVQALDSIVRRINTVVDVGSRVAVQLAFNGMGVDEAGGAAKDALYVQARKSVASFLWESHTWSHLDLTSNTRLAIGDYTDDGVLHNTTYAEAYDDISRNVVFANQLFATAADRAYYESESIVTPKISGLFNAAAIRALLENGHRYAVGDNSIAALRPANVYAGIRTTVQTNGYAGLLIVPRFPTEIYYDCALPAEQVDQYNTRYRSYWGRDLTLDEMLGLEAKRTVGDLMRFRHDPYMFHQANVVSFSYKDPITGKSTSGHSLLSLWMLTVLKELRTYSSFPVQTLGQTPLAREYEKRMALESCGARVSLVLGAANSIEKVRVSSSVPGAGCEVPINNLAFTTAGLRSETYGGDTTRWLTLAGGASVEVPLSSPVLL